MVTIHTTRGSIQVEERLDDIIRFFQKNNGGWVALTKVEKYNDFIDDTESYIERQNIFVNPKHVIWVEDNNVLDDTSLSSIL